VFFRTAAVLLPDEESALKDRRKEYALEYAGFWVRLAAGLVDVVILAASVYVLYCVISQSFFWLFPDIRKLIAVLSGISGGPTSGAAMWLLITILLVFLLVSTIYFVTCWTVMGHTVGKLSLGIKIIRTDSSPVDLKCAFLRFLASLLCVATLGIGFLVIAFDSRKQGLHDHLADTYVVKLPVKQVALDQSLAGGSIG
jgi:uncharacterized RDD family membrane protein YckC